MLNEFYQTVTIYVA